MNGHELIAAERTRQRVEEGYELNYDKHLNTRGELIRAALSYIYVAQSYGDGDPEWMNKAVTSWPWYRRLFKPTEPIYMLVKAGALIAAEIDRLQLKKQEPGLTVNVDGKEVKVCLSVEGDVVCSTSHSSTGGAGECGLMKHCFAIDVEHPCFVKDAMEELK